MIFRQIPACFFLIVFTLVGCNPLTQFENPADVRLESEKEAFSSSEEVQLTLVNETDEDLYLNYCGPALIYKLESKEKEDWVSYAGGLCLAVYTFEFVPVLEPGASKEIIFDSLEAGEYRFNLSYKLNSSGGDSKEISVEFLVQ